jgi:hypothetical protein
MHDGRRLHGYVAREVWAAMIVQFAAKRVSAEFLWQRARSGPARKELLGSFLDECEASTSASGIAAIEQALVEGVNSLKSVAGLAVCGIDDAHRSACSTGLARVVRRAQHFWRKMPFGWRKHARARAATFGKNK